MQRKEERIGRAGSIESVATYSVRSKTAVAENLRREDASREVSFLIYPAVVVLERKI